MDRRERWADMQETLRLAMVHQQAKVWTSVPGIVLSFNAGECTAVVQPAIGGIRQSDAGQLVPMDLPTLHDVPVVFPRGGGCVLTFPIREGDECLLVFSARPIDGWWQSGGVQRPANARMHDLSDGFAIVGPVSAGQVPANISASAVQLRTDDGQAMVEINPSSHAMRFVAPGGLTIDAPVVRINGAITQGAPAGGGSAASTLIGPLAVSQDVTAQGKSMATHRHTEHDGPSTSMPT